MCIRYKILIVFLFLAANATAQNPPLVVPRSSAAVIVTDARLDAHLNLKIPVVNDTTNALNNGLDSIGLIIQVRGTGAQYKRDTFPGGHKWTIIGSGFGDSTAFYTKYRSDTSRTNIYGAIGLKRDVLDTAYAHFLMTRAWGYKINDSMKIVNDARYIQNLLGVPFIGYGAHSSHPTSGNAIYYDTDSSAFFYYSGGTGVNLTGVFNVFFRAKGGPGDTAYVFGRGSNIYVSAVRDSVGSCIHHIINPDSSWTWYSTCTVGAPVDSSWLNAGWFIPGGAPDGAHDNTAQIQAAWNYAAAHNKNIYLPPGSYIDSSQLTAPTTGSLSVSWNFAPGASISYMAKTGNAFLYTGAAFHDILFINPQIYGVHDTTNVGPAGILMQGLTQSQRIKRVAILNGTLKGFVSCVSAKGVDDLEMSGVHFLADHGHDDGTTTTVPNVMIRAQVDSFGDMCKRWNIHDCFFDGYSGSAAISTFKTQATMDGSFYGFVSGLIFHHNHIWRMGEEAIVYQPGLAVIDSLVSVIDDNSIYGTVPAGAKEPNGVKNHHAIGISAVGQHIRVLNNHMYGMTHAIESIAFGLWNAAFPDVVISGNDWTLSKDTAMYPIEGIYDQGYAGVPSKYHVITNNTLIGDSATLTANYPVISLINNDSATIANNRMLISGRTIKTGHTVTGIALNTVTAALIGDNTMIGVDTRQSNTSATFSNSTVVNAGGANSIQTGILSARPASSGCQCFFASTTDSTLYYDPVGGGGWIPMQKVSSGGSVSNTDSSIRAAAGVVSLNLAHKNFWQIPQYFDTAYFSAPDLSNHVWFYGDSYFWGVGATSQDSGVSRVTARGLGKIDTAEYNGSGEGLVESNWSIYTNGYTQSNPANAVISLSGLNDISKSRRPDSTDRMFFPMLTAFWGTVYGVKPVPGNDASIVQTGSWAGVNLTTGSPYYLHRAPALASGGLLIYSSTAGSFVTTTFSGDNVIIFFLGSDGINVHYGKLNVLVDGTQVGVIKEDSIGDGNTAVGAGPSGIYNNQQVPCAQLFSGFGPGTHTLKLVIPTGQVTVSTIDAIGVLANPFNCARGVMGEIPHLTAHGYSLQHSVQPWNDNTVDSANLLIDSAVRQFQKLNFPLGLLKTSNYFAQSTADWSTDSLHPDNLGHRHLATGFINTFDSILVAFPCIYQVAHDLTMTGAGTTSSPLAIDTLKRVVTPTALIDSILAHVGTPLSGLTTNFLPKATSSSTLGNSTIQDNAGNIAMGPSATPQSFATLITKGANQLSGSYAQAWQDGTNAYLGGIKNNGDLFFGGMTYTAATNTLGSASAFNINSTNSVNIQFSSVTKMALNSGGGSFAGTWTAPTGSVGDQNNNLATNQQVYNSVNTSWGASGATSNYTVTTANAIVLSDLTGQANRTLVLPSSPNAVQLTLLLFNINPASSGFTWSMSGATVKDATNTTVTALSNLTNYVLRWDNVNSVYRLSAFGSNSTGFYQTVQSNGTAQTQRAKLNFGAQFTIADNSGNGSTDISVSTSTLNSGAYVPTLTNTTNVSSSTSDSAFWTRSGNIVTVFGHINVTATSSASSTQIKLTIPVASNIVPHSLWGSGSSNAATNTGVVVISDGLGFTGRAEIQYTPTTSGATDIYYSYSYIVQ